MARKQTYLRHSYQTDLAVLESGRDKHSKCLTIRYHIAVKIGNPGVRLQALFLEHIEHRIDVTCLVSMVLTRLDGSGEVHQVIVHITEGNKFSFQRPIVAIIRDDDAEFVLGVVQIQASLHSVQDYVDRLLAGGNNQVDTRDALALSDVYARISCATLSRREGPNNGDNQIVDCGDWYLKSATGSPTLE